MPHCFMLAAYLFWICHSMCSDKEIPMSCPGNENSDTQSIICRGGKTRAKIVHVRGGLRSTLRGECATVRSQNRDVMQERFS